ncbi:MAG: hypothetical protein ACLSAF_02440 [Intestinimonas sp.]
MNLEREVSVLEQKKVTAALEEKQILDKLWETYELSHEAPGPSAWSWSPQPRHRNGSVSSNAPSRAWETSTWTPSRSSSG